MVDRNPPLAFVLFDFDGHSRSPRSVKAGGVRSLQLCCCYRLASEKLPLSLSQAVQIPWWGLDGSGEPRGHRGEETGVMRPSYLVQSPVFFLSLLAFSPSVF